MGLRVGFCNHVWPAFETGNHGPNKDEVKRRRPSPFLLNVVDFETTVGWYARKTTFLVQRRDGAQNDVLSRLNWAEINT